jgi:phosphopantothenate---cysteine ligase (ATP)
MDAENRMEDMGQTLEAQVKAFFDSAPPLHNSHEITQKLNQFIQRNSSSSGDLASDTSFKSAYFFSCCFHSK